MTDFVTKDNGQRAQLEGGMVRDTEEGKTRWDLIPDMVFFLFYGDQATSKIITAYIEQDWVLFLSELIRLECNGNQIDFWKRQAELMERGAKKYGEENWKLGTGKDAHERYRKSLNRHFKQWLMGDREEDHAVACAFNINGLLYTEE